MSEVCGAWMPVAKAKCGLRKGHTFNHNSPEAVAARLASQAQRSKKWRESHPVDLDEAAEQKRIWRKSNADKVAATNRRYRETHPETVRIARRKRKARLRGVPSEPYTRDDVLRAWGVICYLCDSIVPDDWQVEHVIPISRGGHDTVGNVRPACPGCNHSKSNKLSPIYLLAHSELIKAVSK